MIWGFNPRTPCGVRLVRALQLLSYKAVSIHALLAECDSDLMMLSTILFSFNPRTPCGVRQPHQPPIRGCEQFQSTHSLRSATRHTRRTVFGVRVSIHALLAECDKSGAHPDMIPKVSIHALLAECDGAVNKTINQNTSFNPRTPCGVRPVYNQLQPQGNGFNPRTPCGVRRTRVIAAVKSDFVSIHALLAECD